MWSNCQSSKDADEMANQTNPENFGMIFMPFSGGTLQMFMALFSLALLKSLGTTNFIKLSFHHKSAA